jgi:hypothetical protein
MFKPLLINAIFLFILVKGKAQHSDSWVRVNQLGYNSEGTKVAVLGSKSLISINNLNWLTILQKK